MNITDKQIKIIKELKEVTRDIYSYEDQMIAIAIFIDAELERAKKRIVLYSE